MLDNKVVNNKVESIQAALNELQSDLDWTWNGYGRSWNLASYRKDMTNFGQKEPISEKKPTQSVKEEAHENE
jgi:hypothetical protein